MLLAKWQSIALENIICDIVGRINNNISDLLKSFNFSSKLSFILNKNNKAAAINRENDKQNKKTTLKHKQLTIKNSKGVKINLIYQ